ncbi:MAG TPA: NAD-dependent isocitrate dehydrogenase [Planctomycetes bacterium]|nr:NAD-dependent isocitrate dehydrogenase [Planctomycetota bacterium]|tara:strand:- start:211 stop:1215 length:1005 start_codon:yes stop_codon:yes gene_type:complete
MAHHVTLIPGDGIGTEITAATLHVLEATGVDFDWDRVEVGEVSLAAGGEVLPEAVFDSIRRTGVALKGPVGTPIGSGHRSVNVTIRRKLDLYACLRPVKNIPGIETPFDGVDLAIVRENTEGLYSGIEHMVTEDVAESLKIITRKGSTRIARFAFEHAQKRGIGKVTAVHKANIMKISDGLFLECVRKVREEFPGVDYEEMIVDNCAMQLVRWPRQFGVLVMNNLYGDILSDLTAGLVGGLGVSPGANIGADQAVFEPIHGTAPDIAGKGWANPTAMLLSAALLLEHLGEDDAASRLRSSLERVLGAREVRTRDLGGEASTMEFAEAVAKAIKQ